MFSHGFSHEACEDSLIVQLFRESRNLTVEPFNPLSISPSHGVASVLKTLARQFRSWCCLLFVVIVIAACTSGPRCINDPPGVRPCNRLWEIIIVPRRIEKKKKTGTIRCPPRQRIFLRLSCERWKRRQETSNPARHAFEKTTSSSSLSLLICIHFWPHLPEEYYPLDPFLIVLFEDQPSDPSATLRSDFFFLNFTPRGSRRNCPRGAEESAEGRSNLKRSRSRSVLVYSSSSTDRVETSTSLARNSSNPSRGSRCDRCNVGRDRVAWVAVARRNRCNRQPPRDTSAITRNEIVYLLNDETRLLIGTIFFFFFFRNNSSIERVARLENS